MWWYTPSLTLGGGLMNSKSPATEKRKGHLCLHGKNLYQNLRPKTFKMIALLPFRTILVRDQMWEGGRVCRGEKARSPPIDEIHTQQKGMK